MTRNTFLASIAALFAAPFIGKRKEPEVWKKANPRLLHYESVTLSERDRQFIDSQAITAKEICRIYKLPEDLLKRGYTHTYDTQ